MVVEGEIINYANKTNIEQAIEALETIYNSIENKNPNMLPRIITSPYPRNLEDNFLIKTSTSTNLDKAKCKICIKEVDILYMRSHVAVHILKGTPMDRFVVFVVSCIQEMCKRLLREIKHRKQ